MFFRPRRADETRGRAGLPVVHWRGSLMHWPRAMNAVISAGSGTVAALACLVLVMPAFAAPFTASFDASLDAANAARVACLAPHAPFRWRGLR